MLEKILSDILNSSKSLSASELTHILKSIGGGNMQQGLLRTIQIALKKVGRLYGPILFLAGGATTLLIDRLWKSRKGGFLEEVLIEGLKQYGNEKDLDEAFASLKDAVEAKRNEVAEDQTEQSEQVPDACVEPEKIETGGGEFDADEAWSEEGPAAEGI